MKTLLEILPDLLRGGTTTICLLILLPILSKTKLQRKYSYLLTATLSLIDLFICALFYTHKDYTGVLYYSLAFYLFAIVGLKFIYKDKVLQWLFNSVTVLNIYGMIVISSYFLAGLFPYPKYGNTIIRIIFFIITIFFFKKLLRPLFLEVSENWGAFLLPTTGILANYLYILLSLGDVEISMSKNIVFFCFITIVAILTYIAIIFSLKSLRVKFLFREENIKRQANEELLRSEITFYESIVNAAKQTRHDIRHHNSILVEYLNDGDIDGAKEYLTLYDDRIKETAIKNFSKNPITNAVFRIYYRRAREHHIDFVVNSEADHLLKDRLPDIGIVLSNIFENALTACKKCTFSHTYISYSSKIQKDSILIEIKNSVEGNLIFENGLPITTKEGGGTGLLSVKSIVEEHHGMLDVKQEHDEFFTLIILPISTKE